MLRQYSTVANTLDLEKLTISYNSSGMRLQRNSQDFTRQPQANSQKQREVAQHEHVLPGEDRGRRRGVGGGGGGISPGAAPLHGRGGRGEVRGRSPRCPCGVLHPGCCCPAGRLPRGCGARGAAGRRHGACRRKAHSCGPRSLRAPGVIVPPDDHLRPPGPHPEFCNTSWCQGL